MAAEEQTMQKASMLEVPQSVAELVEVAAAAVPRIGGTPIIHVEGLNGGLLIRKSLLISVV